MKTRALILAGLGLAVATLPANAYRYRTCEGTPLRMSSNQIVAYASANSFPAGYWRDGLQNAINQFNRNPSNVFYSLNTDTDGLRLGNGQNEIWAAPTSRSCRAHRPSPIPTGTATGCSAGTRT